MKLSEIKSTSDFILKPNIYFDKPDVPFNYQKKGALVMLASPRMVLGDDIGLGKGQPIDSKILTPIGWKRLGDLSVGSTIIGSDGKPTIVTGLYNRGRLPTYFVNFSDGSRLQVDGDHLWSVSSRKGSSAPRRVVSTSYLFSRFNSNLIRQRLFIPIVKPPEFPPVHFPLPPYIFGLCLLSGVSGIVSIPGYSIKIEDHSSIDLQPLLQGWYLSRLDSSTSFRLMSPKGEDLQTYFKSQHLLDTDTYNLFTLGRIGKYLISSISQRTELLYGLLDSIKQPFGVSYSLRVPSPPSLFSSLKDSIISLVQSLGGTVTSCLDYSSTCSFYDLQLHLPRNKSWCMFAGKKLVSKKEPFRYITSVEVAKAAKIVCISVSSPDSLYVTENYIVTHNTLESIVSLTYAKSKQPSLRAVIFTEKSALIQWRDEFRWLTKGLDVQIICAETHVKKSLRLQALKVGADVIITTYHTVYSCLDELMLGLGPDYVVIADECNYFKNHGTKMYKQMRILMEKATRAYGLTATILENRLEEVYNILKMVSPNAIMSRKDFESLYCLKKPIRIGYNQYRQVTVGYRNIPDFRRKVEPIFFGRLQTDPEVLQQLPEDIHKNIKIMMSLPQSKKYQESVDGLLMLADGTCESLVRLQSLVMCQILANSPSLKGFDIHSAKEDALLEMLQNSLSGEKVIVFSKYRTQIDRLEGLVEQTGIKYARITGAEDMDARNLAKLRFNSFGDTSINVLFLTKAGQKALNLQAGGHVIFYDLPWSYGIYRQIVGRVKRTGSKHQKVMVYRFLAELHDSFPEVDKRTVDHYTLETLLKKKDLFNAVTGDETTILDSNDSASDIIRAIIEARSKLLPPLPDNTPF